MKFTKPTSKSQTLEPASRIRESQNGRSPVAAHPLYPGAVLQKKMQGIANQSPRMKQIRQFQAIANGQVIQRASEYDGLVPGHDTYGDDYEIGPADNRQRASDFTYHHIIPENKLVKVKAELDAIAQHSNAGTDHGALNTSKDNLVTNARLGWKTTRIKNLTVAINSDLGYLGVNVQEADVRGILDNIDEQAASLLDQLFAAFVPMLKTKVRGRYSATKAAYLQSLENTIDQDWENYKEANPPALSALLANSDPQPFYTNDYLGGRLNNEFTYGLHKNIRKRTIRDKVMTLVSGFWNFTDYWDNVCGPIHQNATSPGYLKQILQKKALPHDEDEHLTHAVQWNPGNLHRGPGSSKRLNPASGGFQALLDDGGNDFEKAAANLIDTGHYQELEALNAEIDRFLALGKTKATSPANQAKIDAARTLVDHMRALQNRGLKAFNPNEWEPHGADKMRLKENDAKLRAVGLKQ